jgi:hypothetical protein
MNDILRWLNSSKDYAVGLNLLKAHSSNKFLIKVLESGNDYWNAKSLEKELRKLSEESSFKIDKPQVIAEETLKKPSEQISAPLEIQEIIAERKKIYNEGKKLHARLEYYQTNQERLEASLRILQIRRQLKKLWNITNFYDEHKRMPSQEEHNLLLELEALSDMELNSLFLKHYKFLHKQKELVPKHDDFDNRRKLIIEIKNLLIERDAFCHEGHTIPEYTGKSG